MSHYYRPGTGEPCHFIEKKDGKGTRPTNIGDCRKLGLLPSPSTVLKLLAKPQLEDWKARQMILAVTTAPDLPGETIDQKITRVLDVERQHEQEAADARDIGSAIHDSIQLALNGKAWDTSLKTFVAPVIDWVNKSGRVIFTEKVLMAKDHAGMCDCAVENDSQVILYDFKSCKTLPKYPWNEHRLQLSSYAASIGNTGDKHVECANIYISKTEPGKIAVLPIENWPNDYRKFRLLLEFWYLENEVEKPL